MTRSVRERAKRSVDAKQHVAVFDCGASRTYMKSGTQNVTHQADRLRNVTGRKVLCANGGSMQISHVGYNGKIEAAYTPQLDGPDLISAAQICEDTGAQIVLESGGAFITKGDHQIDTSSKVQFGQISTRQEGSLETYEMTAEQCNEWLGTKYFETTAKSNEKSIPTTAPKRRYRRSFVRDKRKSYEEMHSQLREKASLIMEDNPAESFQARLCNIPGKRIAQLLRTDRHRAGD